MRATLAGGFTDIRNHRAQALRDLRDNGRYLRGRDVRIGEIGGRHIRDELAKPVGFVRGRGGRIRRFSTMGRSRDRRGVEIVIGRSGERRTQALFDALLRALHDTADLCEGGEWECNDKLMNKLSREAVASKCG